MSELDSQFRILEMLLDDLVSFSECVLDLKPFPYQMKFLQDKSHLIVVCAGRQIGKSLMTSVRALWFALTHENTNTLIVSATLRQSMLLFEKVMSFIDVSPLLIKSVAYRSRTRIKFTNGSWITALPCGTIGKTLRGATANQIIIDEAAFVPDRVISEVLLPMTATTNGNVIMLSTPFDKDHIFFKAFTSPSWSKYHFPSSVNPLITKEFLDYQLELQGQLVFDQEYNAQFVDDQKAFFPMSLLRSSLHYCAEDPCSFCELQITPEKLAGRNLFAGYDPGGKVDPSAFVIVEKQKDKSLHVVFTKTYLADPKKEVENLYTNFSQEIAEYHKKFRLSRLYVDSTGLGSPIVEQLKNLKLPAQGIQLTLQSKDELFSNLKLLFENKRLTLPNNLSLLSNLNCIQADAAGGHYAFSHNRGSHDDLAYALGLACLAATKETVVVMMNRDENAVGWRNALPDSRW